MDLSKLQKQDTSGFKGYGIPECFELAGKHLSITFDDGEKLELDFAAAPKQELSPGNSRVYSYSCIKTGKTGYFISYTEGESCTFLALDTGSGLVTRIAADASAQASHSFGTLFPGAVSGQSISTDDFAGNAFEWSFGAEAACVIRARYEPNYVSISYPLAGSVAPAASVTGFIAFKLSEGIYLQNAAVTIGGMFFSVALVTNFNNMLCAGGVFGVNGGRSQNLIVGGYGCAVADSEMQPPKTDLYQFNKYGQHAIVQFAPPPCYELAGETFVFEMDDGCDYILSFKDGENAEWAIDANPPKPEKYACLKADDFTYLVSIELSGLRPRVNHTFVIDKENMLVTRIISSIGRNKRWPYLMTTEIEFGSIRRENAEFKPYPRHTLTSDMIGTVVEWAYGSEMSTTHVYHDANFYRLTFARSRAASVEDARESYAFNNMANNLPSSDEPTDYIKIKDGMYLVSLAEKNCEKLLGPAVGFRSNTLCFLQNYKNGGYVAGRAFGTSTTDRGDIDTNIVIGAYGYFIGAADDELKHLLADPNPFTV